MTLHHNDAQGGIFGDEKLHVRLAPLSDGLRLVQCFHRHHGRIAWHKFPLICHTVNRLRVAECGVAIVGRPVSRHLDDGETLEITRLAVINGTPNAASKLLGAAAREAKRRGGSWDSPSRPRTDKHLTCPKNRRSRRLC